MFGAVPGFIGPVGAPVEVVADQALEGLRGLVAGGNEPDLHLRGVEPGRDFAPTWADVRSVEAGDTAPDGAKITIEPAIEIGNIFKLGLRYSEPLGARYLDDEGREQLVWMGSYGIGPARVVAAAVEQGADEQGIAWPRARRALRRGAGDARQGGGGGANRGRPPLRGAARGRARGALRRPDRRARARSSPTRSCSAARCG